MQVKRVKGLFALSPLVVFVVLYLGVSLATGDFYKMPISVAFLTASVFAVAVSGGMPLAQRIRTFSQGASSGNIMQMIWIFVLAGAFAHTAKQLGCIQATVDLTLWLLPDRMLLAGLFLGACFISMSIGTSVGTIVALTPIATGIAQMTGSPVPLLVAIVVGGSFFGDNLSFISDTTIAATQTQGCRLSDKFRVNAFLVVPAALFCLLIYLWMGQQTQVTASYEALSPLKVMPYLAVIIAAVMGMNVMAVLTVGTILCGVIGIGSHLMGSSASYDLFGWFSAMGNGLVGMGELIIITMMAGGMLEIIRENGGINYIIDKITAHVSSKRGAELSIAALVSMVNICTANNTVAILTVGNISKKIGDKFGVDNRKAASILDTFSCTVQGLIPYGVQMLLAAGLANLSPMDILPYLYYPMAIGVAALLAILLRYPKRYS